MRPAWLGSTSTAVVVLTAACALSCVTAPALPQPSDETTIVIAATATDGSGTASAAEAVLTVVQSPADTSLHSAKCLPDGAAVQVTDLVSTTSSADLAGVFYAERRDRTGGIGIVWGGVVSRGDAVAVKGVMTTSKGERFIQAHTLIGAAASP